MDAGRAVGPSSIFQAPRRTSNDERRTFDLRARGLRGRVHDPGAVERLLSLLPGVRRRVRRAVRARIATGAAARAPARARSAGGRVDCHPRERRERRIRVFVCTAAVRIHPPVRRLDDVQRRRAIIRVGAGNRACVGGVVAWRRGSRAAAVSRTHDADPRRRRALARPRASRRRDPHGALAATAFVLSLGPEPAVWSHRLLSSGPYLWLVRVVPGMDGLRVPARMSVLVLMSLSVLAALGAARVLARLPRRAAIAAAAGLGVAIFAEGWSVPLRMAAFDAHGRADDRSAYRWLAQQPAGAATELPILEWAIAPTLTYQYATLSHGHPIVNGYSGYGSSLQTFLGGAASPLHDLDRMEDALELLRAIGVRYVIVHPRYYADPGVGEDTVTAIRARSTLASETFRSDTVAAFTLTGDHVQAGDLAPSAPAGHRLRPDEFHADASDAVDRLPLAFDGDGDTRWLTGRPQSGDEWIRLTFDRARDISQIELKTAARSFGDYPRELRIESIGDNGASSVLYHGPMLVPYGRALAQGGPQPA